MAMPLQSLLLLLLLFIGAGLIGKRLMDRPIPADTSSSGASTPGGLRRHRPSLKQLRDLMPDFPPADPDGVDPLFMLTHSSSQEVTDLPTIAEALGKTTGVIGIPPDTVERGLVQPDRFQLLMQHVAANTSHYTALLQRPTFWSQLKDAHPRLLYLHQTLPDEFADDLVRVAERQIKRSQVIMHPKGVDDPQRKEGIDPVRTSHGMFIQDLHEWTMPATMSLRLRAARMVGVPEENIEATQILRYQAGQFYKSHMDAFDSWDTANMGRGGQRVATMLTWLNDVPDNMGGDTSFPLAGIKIAPRKGDSVLFYDVDRQMKVDKFSEHGGNPPQNGTVKWCAVLWIHPKKFD